MDLRMPGVGGLTAMEQRASVDLPAPAAGRVAPGERVIVGVRPEYVTVSTTGDGPITGTVSIIEHLGTSSLVTVGADGTLIGATVPEEAEPPPGTTVSLTPNPGRVLIYRESDGALVSWGQSTVECGGRRTVRSRGTGTCRSTCRPVRGP